VNGVSLFSHAHVHVFTNKNGVRDCESARRKQACFAQYLKAVADAQHEFVLRGELFHCVHHGRKAGQRAGAQVVTVRKSARNDQRVIRRQFRVAMPDEVNRLPPRVSRSRDKRHDRSLSREKL
jgi:hypothetical protein